MTAGEVFDVRAAAAVNSDDYPGFEFIGLDGKQYTLPNPLLFTEREVARIRAGDQTPIEERAPEAFEALQDLPMHVTVKLGEAWWGSAEEAGKSLRPSRQIRRAAQRSKQT